MVVRPARTHLPRRGQSRFGPRRPAVLRGYRRILVPVLDNPESRSAMAAACRLAADRHASITVVTVIEVPPILPLDAHMTNEEREARQILARADAMGASYGIGISVRVLRGRDADTAIVKYVESTPADLVVIGAPRRSRRSARAPVFGRTVQNVLKKAPCRVMVVAAKTEPDPPLRRAV